MNRDENTFRLLTKECQNVSYTDIPSLKYEVALQKTFDNFCHYCKIENKSWFHLCDDDYLKETVLLDEDERFPTHKVDTWWMDLPKQKENIFKFLGALAVNPTWDIGYRFMNVTEVSNKYIPCWCPCHHNYGAYFSDMTISYFLPERSFISNFPFNGVTSFLAIPLDFTDIVTLDKEPSNIIFFLSFFMIFFMFLA